MYIQYTVLGFELMTFGNQFFDKSLPMTGFEPRISVFALA